MFKWIAAAVFIPAGLLIGWHYYLVGDMRRLAEFSAKPVDQGDKPMLTLNPLNDVIQLTFVLPPVDDEAGGDSLVKLGSQLGKGLVQGLSKLAEPLIERELNTKARESFDLYAWAIPYRVRVTIQDPDPETVAALKEKHSAQRKSDELKKKAEEQQGREKITSYILQGMALENVRSAAGERFGQRVHGIFGTIINKGDKTLNEVAVRVYFLDAGRKRISEAEYHPVLVSKYSIGDNTPLRPGYRKDFGYSVDREAPTNWAKRIEAEIVDVKFAE